MSEEITVQDFISRLINVEVCPRYSKMPVDDVYKYGRIRGWLEEGDERFKTSEINRRTAARILHQFMKIELGIPDLADISKAECLRDLYTCRVCANHIAQVYLRGFFEAEEIEQEGQICLVFNQLKRLERKEIENCIFYLESNSKNVI